MTYDPIGTVFGTQAVGNVPYDSSLTGSDGSVLPLLRYTASDGSNELASGITIAEDTGIVTVAGTADARTETHYTVMVSADGYQPGMLNGAVSITVDQKDFSNAPIFDANSLSAAVDSQTAASHSILHTGSGYTFRTDYDLSIAPVPSNQNTTGAITIAATGDIGIGSGVTVADAGTYTVTATGKGNYSGVSTARFQLFI